MTRPTPQELRESVEFVANTISAYTNGLDMVARKPFAECAGNHMKTIMLATQQEPEVKKEKK
jgi:hypothetical protein